MTSRTVWKCRLVGVLAAAITMGSCITVQQPQAAPSPTPSLTPTPSPTAAQTPTPAPTPSPAPTPRDVALRASQIVLPPFEFPRTLWTVGADEAEGATGWRREFMPFGAGDYHWAAISVDVTISPLLARARVTAVDCQTSIWPSGSVPTVRLAVTAENVGEVATACAYHWPNIRQFYYYVAVRNVYIRCGNNPRSLSLTDADALQLCIDIARKQVEVINRVAPAR